MFTREGVFRRLETTAVDAQLRLHGSTDQESDIVIVLITDKDYSNLFQNKSPLDPAGVKTVLDSIALGRPKVIGVDLDTSASSFRDLRFDASSPPIVWARRAAYSNIRRTFHVFEVLGGNSPPLSAVALLKQDTDGALRSYSRSYKIPDGSLFPSFPSLVANQFNSDRGKDQEQSDDNLFIRYGSYTYGSRFVKIEALKLIDFSKDSDWPNNPIIRNKIVLLGGAYAASDEYDTPVGWINGVEVLAHATQTELDGGGVKPAPHAVIVLLELFDGLVLLLLFQQFRFSKAISLSLAAIPVFSLACSFVAFRSFAFWAYFMPIIIAVLLQQLYDRAKEYRKKAVANAYDTIAAEEVEANKPRSIRPIEKTQTSGKKRK